MKMIGPSSQISKMLLGLLFVLIIYYLYMDIQLYLRIQNYPLERNYHFNIDLDADANANLNVHNNKLNNSGISSTRTNIQTYNGAAVPSLSLSSSPLSLSSSSSSSSSLSLSLLPSASVSSSASYLNPYAVTDMKYNHQPYNSGGGVTSTNIPIKLKPLKVAAAVSYESQTWMSCEINPLCHVTVKAILLDHTNHYLFAPLVKIFDSIVHITRSSWITANMISFFHVGVACLAGRFIACDSLGYRRMGAVMFELRTFLDDLDGHVARVKKNIRGERSEVGTAGYYIDGICDALGCIGLLLGMFIYLKNNPPRRGYLQLPMMDPRALESNATAKAIKLKTSTRKVAKKVIIFTGQLLLSSAAWNRYIAVYQDMLERNDVSAIQMTRQIIIFKSTWFFCVAWLWRLINVHSLLHYVLLSIFCDKLWEFLKAIQYIGYLLLLICICLTEMHLLEAHNFIYGSVISTNITSF